MVAGQTALRIKFMDIKEAVVLCTFRSQKAVSKWCNFADGS